MSPAPVPVSSGTVAAPLSRTAGPRPRLMPRGGAAGLCDDTLLVRLAEAPPPARRRRSGRRNVGNRLLKHMLRYMLKPAAAAVKRLAGTSGFLGSELRAPVPEALQRQPVRLAILPLIQGATALPFQMRPPERFQFRVLRRCHPWHDRSSSLTNLAVERTSHSQRRRQSCQR